MEATEETWNALGVILVKLMYMNDRLAPETVSRHERKAGWSWDITPAEKRLVVRALAVTCEASDWDLNLLGNALLRFPAYNIEAMWPSLNGAKEWTAA